jgi:hypothetical protein
MTMEKKTGSIGMTIEGRIGNVPESFEVSFTTALEMLYILGMGNWEASAPPPGQHGLKGDEWLENSQQARLQYLLQGIGLSDADRVYSLLATKTRYSRTNDSSVTRVRPAQGLPLKGSWYLDCCLSLPQKLEVVETLKHLGYSRDFIETAKRFVAGKPIEVAVST